MLRVAVGDADPTFASALCDLIGDAGLRCVGTASTGEALIELVDVHDVDVIAMDVRFPGLRLTIRKVRARERVCRIVVMSALVTPASRSVARDVGMNTIVSKLHGEDLIAAIAAH